jgi:hypothetical protein
MGKKSKPNEKYADNFLTEWHKNKGLILQSESARILNVTETQINNLAKTNKLNKIKINGKAYIGYSGLCEIYYNRIKNN